MRVRQGVGLTGFYILEGTAVSLERHTPRPYLTRNGSPAGTRERGLSLIKVDGVLRGYLRLPHALDMPAEVHSIVSLETHDEPVERIWQVTSRELEHAMLRVVRAVRRGAMPTRRDEMNRRLAKEAEAAAKARRAQSRREAAKRRKEAVEAARAETARRIITGLEHLRERVSNFTDAEAEAIDLALAAARKDPGPKRP